MNSTTHRIKVTAVCPVDGTTVDEYDLEVDVPDGMLLHAEAVAKAVDLLTAKPITQEHLTQRLADMLHCRVTTDGTHAGGRVKTYCSRDPRPSHLITERDITLKYGGGL